MDTLTTSVPVGAAGGQPSDSMSHEPQQTQTSQAGKLRKTAFRFFRGRKSICMLPNFFGGRGKGQGRLSSKTGVTKSQTYDGVSKACWEESVRGSGDATSVDFEFHSPNGSGDAQKSQSLPRQRRGLRGLLSSIKRHRKSRTAEPEKNESLEMSSAETVPSAPPNVGSHGDDDVGVAAVLDGGVASSGSESGYVPRSALSECMKDETLLPEKWRSTVWAKEEEERRDDEGLDEGNEGDRGGTGGLASYRQPLSADSEMTCLAEGNADLTEAEMPPTSAASDSDNLMFGEVSSLKSFDSLTGCGDIIADQDDVGVAESSVSGERGGRNAGKRSSCLVTYQGGGEEMATPDEVDSQYLHSLWESDVGAEVCYLPSDQTDSPSITPDQPISSFHITTSSSGPTSTSTLGITETVLTPTDLLTPQSDRQESVPNSDEGYYDSTTPGADEETRERPQQEGLPRDSYSGDALYELFEPDDRLLSPPLPSKDSCGFLGSSLQVEKGKGDLLFALTSAALETIAMETEEERLSKIQHALLCCELQTLSSPSKDLYCGDCFYGDTEPLEANCKSSVEEGLHQKGSQLLKEALSPTGGPMYGPAAVSRFSPHPPKSLSTLQSTVLYSEQERCKVTSLSSLPPSRGCSQSQEELMVCFSQALMDFTKNARRYRNSTESLDGSESSSPFGQTLSALPTIVTFDVVDMENEEDCEQQTELVEEEEELTSPFEPFEEDSSYLQQDAFAECDQRALDSYEQSLLLSNAWGITSLPRHLNLGRPCAPVPTLLGLNRRSRSLDTDSLESQTGELYAPLPAHAPKMAIAFHRRKSSLEAMEGRGVVLPRQPRRGHSDGWREGRGCELRSNQESIPSSQQPQKFSCQSSLRPSHLPLQGACRNASPACVSSGGAEGDIVAGSGDVLYPCSYPPGGMQWNSRPVGITQGIPHLLADL
uniref:APC membrane recruitment protein 1 n=1 Tax=Electrophorus electricus TaxID=8005 RepID=A0A4W4ERG7_ELEEL